MPGSKSPPGARWRQYRSPALQRCRKLLGIVGRTTEQIQCRTANLGTLALGGDEQVGNRLIARNAQEGDVDFVPRSTQLRRITQQCVRNLAAIAIGAEGGQRLNRPGEALGAELGRQQFTPLLKTLAVITQVGSGRRWPTLTLRRASGKARQDPSGAAPRGPCYADGGGRARRLAKWICRCWPNWAFGRSGRLLGPNFQDCSRFTLSPLGRGDEHFNAGTFDSLANATI